MSMSCEMMSGNDLLGEIKKEFNLPYDFLSGLSYELDSKYGQIVAVKCITFDGTICANAFLRYKDGSAVSFGQLRVFLERFIVLPNYSKLCLKVGSKGMVVAEVSTFPTKVRG